MANFKEDLRAVKAFVFDVDGVLSQQTIGLNTFGVPNRTINLRDGYAIKMAVKKGYFVGVITGNNAKEYLKRLKQLGVKDVYLNSSIKMNDYLHFMKKHSLDDSGIMYMGDDIPDYNVMKRVGVPVCPADADSEIKQISSYISDKKGGEGCVRDVIEQVLRLNDQWMDTEAFTW